MLSTREHLVASSELLSRIALDTELMTRIIAVGILIRNAFGAGQRLYIAGNGGSHADAIHFAAELVGYFMSKERPVPAIALGCNPSFESAWGNDASFNSKFARELSAYAEPGDVFFAISTSGDSKNVLKAAQQAKEIGMHTIGLIGRDGGHLKDLVAYHIIVPSGSTPLIQEAHISIIHALCSLIGDCR